MPDGLFLPLGRPLTTNVERKGGHWSVRSRDVRLWRDGAGYYALQAGWHRTEWRRVVISARPEYRSRRSWPDVGGTMPAVKAAIDGLVDVGVLRGDDPRFVGRLVLDAPALGSMDGLRLWIAELGD